MLINLEICDFAEYKESSSFSMVPILEDPIKDFNLIEMAHAVPVLKMAAIYMPWYFPRKSIVDYMTTGKAHHGFAFHEGSFSGNLGLIALPYENFYQSLPKDYKFIQDCHLKSKAIDFMTGLDLIAHNQKLKDIILEQGDILFIYESGLIMPLYDHGSGATKVFKLLGPIFDSIRYDLPLFVDNLDEQLHAYTARAILEIFKKTNSKSQLIFTTCQPNMISGMRRDQIWIDVPLKNTRKLIRSNEINDEFFNEIISYRPKRPEEYF